MTKIRAKSHTFRATFAPSIDVIDVSPTKAHGDARTPEKRYGRRRGRRYRSKQSFRRLQRPRCKQRQTYFTRTNTASAGKEAKGLGRTTSGSEMEKETGGASGACSEAQFVFFLVRQAVLQSAWPFFCHFSRFYIIR